MQAVSSIDESPIVGDHHLGGVIHALKSTGQTGDGLLGRQPSARAVVIELDQGGGLLLERIQPADVGVAVRSLAVLFPLGCRLAAEGERGRQQG